MRLQAIVLGLLLSTASSFSHNVRIAVKMPNTLKQTMLMHMREHLVSLQKLLIHFKNQFEKASFFAKNDLKIVQ